MRHADTLRALCITAVITVLLAAFGCQPKQQPIAAGRVVVNPAQSPADHVGDVGYVVIRAASLPSIQERFEAALFDLSGGIQKWDRKMDCNGFAGLWCGAARAILAGQLWHSSAPINAPAVAEVWYRPSGGNVGHAIVQAITDEGTVYWEPQPPGRRLKLSQAEIASIYFRKW